MSELVYEKCRDQILNLVYKFDKIIFCMISFLDDSICPSPDIMVDRDFLKLAFLTTYIFKSLEINKENFIFQLNIDNYYITK